MTGPSFDFAEYKRWVTLTMFDIKVPDPKSTTGGTRRRRKIPHSGLPATMKLVEGTFWLVGFALFSKWYSVEFTLNDQFLKYNFLRRFPLPILIDNRLWYLQPLALTHRLKYYGIWKMAEGACILSGIAFNGYNANGTLRWDRVTNVSPVALETAQNNKEYLEAWNQNTNKWLKNYVYLRVTPRGKKPGFRSAMATFITSAVWHGFYPGYYLLFMSAGFVQTCGKCTAQNHC
jgi:lysophospholipid acyltransferase